MFTSRSEQSTPPELSIASVLTCPPASAYSILPALRHAQVAALADHLRAQLRGVHPHRVVRLVAGVGVRLRAGLHVGPYAAVPEQVDRRAQERLHQLVRLQRLVLDPDASRASGESWIDFAVRSYTPPPGEIASRS